MRDFSAFVDGELDDGRTLEVRVHLDDCEPCLRHLAAYRRGLAIYRSGSDDEAPIDFYERIRSRLAEDAGFEPVPVPVAERRAEIASHEPVWTGSRLGGVVTAVVVAFLFVLAVTPEIENADRDAPSVATIASIPAVTPRIDARAADLEPRAEIARVAIADVGQRFERPAASDASEWPIAEVERHDVRPHPWIVQAAFSLP